MFLYHYLTNISYKQQQKTLAISLNYQQVYPKSPAVHVFMSILLDNLDETMSCLIEPKD